MRRTLLILLAAAFPAAAGAQSEPAPDRQHLPREVRQEVAARWSRPAAIRSAERVEIGAGEEVHGDVAVQHGPLVIAGHVVGSVLAVNSDVVLRPGARVDGDMLVVGGEVEGRVLARIDGSTRIYRQSLRYHMEDERLVPSDSGLETSSWWQRLERGREGSWIEALRVVQAGPYNRVEGLPIRLGPVLHRSTVWGSVRVEPGAVVRTGSSFSGEDPDVGYDVRSEIRTGHTGGLGLGGRIYSVVDPVEGWHLSDLEVALATFLVRRDYRDYYQRHGGELSATLYGSRDLSVTASFADERWTSRPLQNPFTIFNGERPWRPNPLVDEGRFHVGTLAMQFDTRTDPEDPWSGWYLSADVEHGRGTIVNAAPTSGFPTPARTGLTDYTRGLFDFRRYNRLGPAAQLNMRVVLGGWIDGDPLPLQRRLSVDGPGVLPGFDFRSPRTGLDVGTCNAGPSAPGRPAECDRVALAQIEYRGDVRLHFTGDWEDWPRRFHSAHGDVVWVLFADVGRGWKTGQTDDALTYDRGIFPPLSTFRSDVGVGLDLSGIGIYAAKSVSTPAEPLNFFVRLRHRF